MQEMWNVFPACLWPYYKLLKTMRQMFQHMRENLWDRYTQWERHFGQGRYYSMYMIFWKFTSEPSKVTHYFWNRTLGFVVRKVPTHFYLSRRVHTLIVWGMLYRLFGGQFEAPTSTCLINIPGFKWKKGIARIAGEKPSWLSLDSFLTRGLQDRIKFSVLHSFIIHYWGLRWRYWVAWGFLGSWLSLLVEEKPIPALFILPS